MWESASDELSRYHYYKWGKEDWIVDAEAVTYILDKRDIDFEEPPEVFFAKRVDSRPDDMSTLELCIETRDRGKNRNCKRGEAPMIAGTACAATDECIDVLGLLCGQNQARGA